MRRRPRLRLHLLLRLHQLPRLHQLLRLHQLQRLHLLLHLHVHLLLGILLLLPFLPVACSPPPAVGPRPEAPPVEREPAPAPRAVAATPPDGAYARVLRDGGIDPARVRCNHESRWGNALRSDARAAVREILSALGTAPGTAPGSAPGPGASSALASAGDAARADVERRIERAVFWRMVRAVLIEGNNNNLGVFALRGRTYTDKEGRARPVLVFRSGVTPDPAAPGSCFRSLLEHGGVRHVVNLFDGEMPVADLVEAEARVAARAEVTYRTASDEPDGYGPWRDLLRRRYDDPEARAQASRSVARLIREQILAPGGAPPRGNVYFHCGGGMHRSGMIAAVIERCVNGTPLDEVEATYRRHVAWRDPEHPGGLEEGNLRFVREFDCGLLGAEAAAHH